MKIAKLFAAKALFITAIALMASFGLFSQQALAVQDDRSASSYDVSDSSSIFNYINQLRNRVSELQSQLNARRAPSSEVVETSIRTSRVDRPWCSYNWKRSLGVGSSGDDVRQLQIFLNSNSETSIGNSGSGSSGRETNYFGSATLGALKKFQQLHETDILRPAGLSRASGFFGDQTIKKIRKICSDSQNYTIDDVKSVTYRDVDPLPEAVDDEYTEYVITLKNKVKHTVNRNHFAPADYFEKKVRETGYSGDIDELIEMAEEGEDDESSLKARPATGDAPLNVNFRADNLKSGSKYIIEYGDGENSGPLTASKKGMVKDEYDYERAGNYKATLQGYSSCMWANPNRCMMAAMPIDTVNIKVSSSSEVNRKVSLEVDGSVATLKVDLKNGCAGYSVDWGDGLTDSDVKSDNSDSDIGGVCTQEYRVKTLTHTYASEDKYTVSITLYSNSTEVRTYNREIQVPSVTGRDLSRSCYSGATAFAEGTKVNGYSTSDGLYKTISDGVFQCANGNWETKGSNWWGVTGVTNSISSGSSR